MAKKRSSFNELSGEMNHLDNIERYHEIETQWNQGMRDHQAKADEFCRSNGLETVEQMRKWCAARINRIGRLREPGQEG